MITFQIESWQQYFNDPQRLVLWQEHYEELEQAHSRQMPMAPDEAFYAALDSAGILVILTARQDGILVGYCLAVIKRHPHYNAVCGFEDSYYLTPRARKGSIGYRLLKAMRDELTQRGCCRSYWMTKEFASVEVLFQRLGMKKMDSVYCYSTWENS